MIEWQDAINGTFELLGAPFMTLSVLKLRKEKIASGVSSWSIAFCVTWSFWDFYYYPHLDQWISFYGAIACGLINIFWLFQIAYYTKYPGGR